jgi:hypothetical protein
MEQREHRMRLSAAEIRLKLDDRITARAGEAFDRTGQQLLQAMGDEGPLEKIARVFVFVRTLATIDLSEVGGEFCLLEAS